jgi:hypothetical protein
MKNRIGNIMDAILGFFFRNSKELHTACKKDEWIVIYKEGASGKDCNCVRENINKDISSPEVISRSSCGKIEKWKCREKNSFSQIEKMVSGIGSNTVHTELRYGIGEGDNAYVSFNFINDLPHDKGLPKEIKYDSKILPDNSNGEKKDKIIIAVLDTGVNTHLIPYEYLWQNEKVNTGENCYKNDLNGWNFIDGTPCVHEKENMHGTLINAYIIEQFTKSSRNSVQLMNLKTHDADGSGDLYSIICALLYAKENGAHIVNASWGFYDYEQLGNLCLENVITKILKEEGILFVTAAGNKIDKYDHIFNAMKRKFQSKLNPRNLKDHHFYPACFTKDIEAEDNNINCLSPSIKLMD